MMNKEVANTIIEILVENGYTTTPCALKKTQSEQNIEIQAICIIKEENDNAWCIGVITLEQDLIRIRIFNRQIIDISQLAKLRKNIRMALEKIGISYTYDSCTDLITKNIEFYPDRCSGEGRCRWTK